MKRPDLWGFALVLSLLTTLASCGLVRDDLPPCPNPRLALRFVYNYNMEYANAFPNQVHCLTVYFFDANGELLYIDTITDPELLSDEDWRLYPKLEPGDYHVVAYGGMACEDASFYQAGNFPEGTHYTNLHVQLDPVALSDPDKRMLHNHFYGSLDLHVDGDDDKTETVEMMRNTNNIHIAIQNENVSEPIDHNDFIFEITDDNNDFAHDNSLMKTGVITYSPWLKENRSTAPSLSDVNQAPSDEAGTDQQFHAAVAHFTTSRLMDISGTPKETSTTLNIHKADGTGTVFSIPLVKYMLMFKNSGAGQATSAMPDQEYLDRENTWNFVFFIKDGFWVQTHLIINDWEVRLNNTDF